MRVVLRRSACVRCVCAAAAAGGAPTGIDILSGHQLLVVARELVHEEPVNGKSGSHKCEEHEARKEDG
jgi:hypothetical protein